MKQILLLALILNFSGIFAQDLVVTKDGDTLNCKISKIEGGYVYFTFKHKNEVRNTLMSTGEVSNYQYNYFKIPEVSSEMIKSMQDYPHFRFAVDGGYSYQLAKVGDISPTVLKKYTEELKKGYHLGAEASYFITEPIGFGLKFQLFKTSNELDNISVRMPDGSNYSSIDDKISIYFIGPIFNWRLLDAKKKNSLNMGASLGYLSYKDIFVNKYTQTGNTLGLLYSIGFDLSIDGNLALGLNLALITGTLNKVDISDGTTTKTMELNDDTKIGLGRIDLSVGLRFNY